MEVDGQLLTELARFTPPTPGALTLARGVVNGPAVQALLLAFCNRATQCTCRVVNHTHSVSQSQRHILMHSVVKNRRVGTCMTT